MTLRLPNANFSQLKSTKNSNSTEDGSVNAVPQILYVQYLILGAFGSYMFSALPLVGGQGGL